MDSSLIALGKIGWAWGLDYQNFIWVWVAFKLKIKKVTQDQTVLTSHYCSHSIQFPKALHQLAKNSSEFHVKGQGLRGQIFQQASHPRYRCVSSPPLKILGV